MKKQLLFSLFFLPAAFALSAQVPAGWQTTPPRDTAAVKYSVGISDAQSSEAAAVKSAWQNALQNLASSIGTNIESRTEVTAQSEGFDGGIEDAFTVRLENSTFTTQVRLTGVSEINQQRQPCYQSIQITGG